MENKKRIQEKDKNNIIMMFYYIEPSRHFRFSVPDVCNFFYSASQMARYEVLFEGFSWTKVAGFYWSEEIITALDELEERFLSCNTYPDGPHWIKESADFENIKFFFINEELRLLESLAKDFLEMFEVKSE